MGGFLAFVLYYAHSLSNNTKNEDAETEIRQIASYCCFRLHRLRNNVLRKTLLKVKVYLNNRSTAPNYFSYNFVNF